MEGLERFLSAQERDYEDALNNRIRALQKLNTCIGYTIASYS